VLVMALTVGLHITVAIRFVDPETDVRSTDPPLDHPGQRQERGPPETRGSGAET
jgi:hypothetical protein